jgi:nicotinate-nucleotide adenylyltransferase
MGGAFNPVHLGHLRAAEEMAARYGLGAVCFVPSSVPPHKGAEGLAPFADRLAMVELAIRGRPGFHASDMESRLPGPSYTVNTLKAFRGALASGSELWFLAGFDSFQNVGLWRSARELFSLATFAVNIRPGARRNSPGSRPRLEGILRTLLGALPAWDPELEAFVPEGLLPVHFFEGSQLAISSTDLRRRIAAGESVRYLVPDPVLDYLAETGLYRVDPVGSSDPPGGRAPAGAPT